MRASRGPQPSRVPPGPPTRGRGAYTHTGGGHATRMASDRFRLASDVRQVRAYQTRALELVQQAESAANTRRANAFRAIAAELELRALSLDAELMELGA